MGSSPSLLKEKPSVPGELYILCACLSLGACAHLCVCVCVHVRARVVIWLPQGICAVVAASGEVCTSARLYASVFQKLELLSVFLFGSW